MQALSTKVVAELKELAFLLDDNFDRLNWGGCCVVAGHIGEILAQYYPVRIAILGNGRTRNLDRIRQKVKNPMLKRQWTDEGVAFNHVVAEFKAGGRWWAFDAEYGVEPYAEITTTWGGRYKGFLTVTEAVSMASEPSGWNSAFDRTQIPGIKDTMEVTADRIDDIMSGTLL